MTTIRQRAETADKALALLHSLRSAFDNPKAPASVTAGQIEAAFFDYLGIPDQPVWDARQLEAAPALAMRCLHQAALVSMGKAKERDKLPVAARVQPIIPIKAAMSMTGALTLFDTAIWLARREVSS